MEGSVFFPSVTICSSNQIRFVPQQISQDNKVVSRVTFLKEIGIYTNQTKKSLLLKNFYTGNETMSLEDNQMSKDLVETAPVQEEFCKYMKHTGVQS